MQAVRRRSFQLVQPIARLFNHEELDAIPRSLTPPPEASPDIFGATPPAAQVQAVSQLPPLDQITSYPGASRSTADADIPLPLQDALYLYQLNQLSPLKLSPIAFHTADIVWRFKDSERVYNTMQKRGIITKEGEIRTAAISNKFAHQFAFLSGFAQRRVIGLLFWWEEEEQRLKRLYQQEKDIQDAIDAAGNGDEDRAMLNVLKIELERTRMLIKQKPSDRWDETASRIQEQLPLYTPPPPGSSRESLPIYTEDPTTFVRS